MIVYVDENSCIKAVGSTDDTTLTPLEINDDVNPFKDWSHAKICAYRCTVSEGHVTMMTPYIDSRALPYIDDIGKQLEDKAEAAEILLGKEE